MTPYTCPHCSTLAPQLHGEAAISRNQAGGGRSYGQLDHSLFLSHCTSCDKKAVWALLPDWKLVIERIRKGEPESAEGDPKIIELVYPRRSNVPDPNDDLPEDIKQDYREAASVLGNSPRSSAALLRLCLQKLCVHFGQPGKDINKDIGELVAAGTIRQTIQLAMDTVRISGNESVHPGELQLGDDKDLALDLFVLINLIADEAITQPKRILALYNKMPENKRQGVQDRDRPKGA